MAAVMDISAAHVSSRHIQSEAETHHPPWHHPPAASSRRLADQHQRQGAADYSHGVCRLQDDMQSFSIGLMPTLTPPSILHSYAGYGLPLRRAATQVHMCSALFACIVSRKHGSANKHPGNKHMSTDGGMQAGSAQQTEDSCGRARTYISTARSQRLGGGHMPADGRLAQRRQAALVAHVGLGTAIQQRLRRRKLPRPV
jgi:hypothetical protein